MKRRSDHTISDEERDLFRDSVGEIRPLQKPNIHRSSIKPKAEPAQSQKSEAMVKDELLNFDAWTEELETGEELSYLKPGLQQRILRRLRRGQYSVQATIDLHEMNSQAAKASIVEFLQQARQHQCYCVKVIHGKGLRSKPGGPVLKKLVNAYLRKRSDVLAFTSARPSDGGTGAIYVLLEKLS